MYLTFIDEYTRINRQFDLSHYEIELLDLVAKAHYSNQNIFIGDLIKQRNIASQATLHSVLKRLLEKKLLTCKSYIEDGRNKKVVLTKLALERYKRLDFEIFKSASYK